MRKKIVFKLTIYFTAILLILSIGIGLVFTILFRNHTVDLYKQNLVNGAIGISETMSDYSIRMRYSKYPSIGFNPYDSSLFGTSSDTEAYISFLNSVTMANVWLIDKNYNFITTGKSIYEGSKAYSYSELPANAGGVIQALFVG